MLVKIYPGEVDTRADVVRREDRVVRRTFAMVMLGRLAFTAG